MSYESSSLDRSLNELFLALHQLRSRPTNPLYSYLPTTITARLVDLPSSIVLSPRSTETDESWAHWGEMDDVSDIEDEASDPGEQSDLRVEPWQTILLLDDDAVDRAGEMSMALVGPGADAGSDEASPAFPSRRSSLEEDESLLMKALIEACDVSKP